MSERFGLAAMAALTAALAAGQSASPPPTAAPPGPALEPVQVAPSSVTPAPASGGPSLLLPVPPPVLRLVDPPVISVETLPADNPFATAVEAPAMTPVKPVSPDLVVPASLFATLRVDPKGKVVSARRARDPIPSLSAQTQNSLARWTFDPGRKAGQVVDGWASVRLDLAVEVDEPKIEQLLLTPVTASTPIAKPLDWGSDAAWLAGVKPGPPVNGTISADQLDTPPAPKKQPWSSSSYKGPFSVRFWVRIAGNGRVEKLIPIQASDPVLLAYFRKALESWLFRPARAAGAAVASWNELTLGGQISFDTELKQTVSLRQSL
ncbi:MAG: hypothetical protein ACRD3M_11670 [Thermoanaerobaculia bacterium]